MKEVKCPLCFGTGKIKDCDNESWEEFLGHSKEYMDGFQRGYDKCSSDERMVILREAYEVAKPFEKQLIEFFVKSTKAKTIKDKESAKTMASLICIELGLNKNIKEQVSKERGLV